MSDICVGCGKKRSEIEYPVIQYNTGFLFCDSCHFELGKKVANTNQGFNDLLIAITKIRKENNMV